jgi:hypothetical protein
LRFSVWFRHWWLRVTPLVGRFVRWRYVQFSLALVDGLPRYREQAAMIQATLPGFFDQTKVL